MKDRKHPARTLSADKKRDFNSKLILPLIFLTGMICRAFLLKRFTEYDEIWSLENYSTLSFGEIFSNFSLPNNHPVNTFLIKLLWTSHENAWTIRLGSLAFSLAAIYFLYDLGRRISGKAAGCYAALAGAVLPPLIATGTTARGYAGQFFFIVLFADMLVRCRRGKTAPAVCAALSGILAIISLPSSILYIAPAGLWFVINRVAEKKFFKVHIICFGSALLFTAIWYAMHLSDFMQSQTFKYPVNDIVSALKWLNEYFNMTAIPFFLLPLALWWKRKRKMTWILFSLILFPLLAAVFTAPAPGRVYLPSAIAGILLFAPGRKFGRASYLPYIPLLGCQIFVSLCALPQTAVLTNMVTMPETPGAIVIYPPNDGYPVSWNYPDSCEKFHRQISIASNLERCVLLTMDKNILSGINAAGEVADWQLPFPAAELTPGSGTVPFVINLQKTMQLESDEIGILLLPPVKNEEFYAVLQLLNTFISCERMQLNPWLTIILSDRDRNRSRYRYAVLALRSTQRLRLPSQLPLFRIVR